MTSCAWLMLSLPPTSAGSQTRCCAHRFKRRSSVHSAARQRSGRHSTTTKRAGFPYSARGNGAGLQRWHLVVNSPEMVQGPDAKPGSTVDSVPADESEDARVL